MWVTFQWFYLFFFSYKKSYLHKTFFLPWLRIRLQFLSYKICFSINFNRVECFNLVESPFLFQNRYFSPLVYFRKWENKISSLFSNIFENYFAITKKGSAPRRYMRFHTFWRQQNLRADNPEAWTQSIRHSLKTVLSEWNVLFEWNEKEMTQSFMKVCLIIEMFYS